MAMEQYLNERVVLTTMNEVCYAGVPTHIVTVDGVSGLLVRLDQRSGFSVWCPESYIKDVLVVPIPRDLRDDATD